MKAQSTTAAAERELQLAYTPHEHEELRALALRLKPLPAAPHVVSAAQSGSSTIR
jgi:hypothetical protein